MGAPVKKGHTGKWLNDISGVNAISILCGHKKIDQTLVWLELSHCMNTQLQCPHCARRYSRETAFKKHVACCVILSSTKKERAQFEQDLEETPPLTEVYKLVQRLVQNEARLHKRIEKLEACLNRSVKRRQDILGWLNDGVRPAHTFGEWVKSVQLTQDDLQPVFANDYVEGIGQAIRRVTEGLVDAPFRCFAHQANTFYIYEKNDAADICWGKTDNAAMTKFIDAMTQKVVEQFKQWQDAQGDNIYTDRGSLIYHKNVRRVMGGTLPREVSHSRLRGKMYNMWKTDTRGMLI